jgi:hypothetical protein
MVDLPRLKIAVEDYGHTRAVKASTPRRSGLSMTRSTSWRSSCHQTWFIEALVSYSLQRRLIPSRPRLDRIFVEIDP